MGIGFQWLPIVLVLNNTLLFLHVALRVFALALSGIMAYRAYHGEHDLAMKRQRA